MLFRSRINLMTTMVQSGMIGKYYSEEWARKNVLHQHDDMIESMDAQIDNEKDDPRWQEPDEGESPDEMDGSPTPQTPQSDNNIIGGNSRGNLLRKLQQARSVIDTIKNKPLEKRTAREQSDYISAVQILAKNKQGDI